MGGILDIFDIALQHLGEALEQLHQGHLAHGARGGEGMPAAAELGEDFADMHLGDARTADHEDPVVHAHGHDQHVEVLHVAQLVRQHGEVGDEVLARGVGDAHLDAPHRDVNASLDQVVEQ